MSFSDLEAQLDAAVFDRLSDDRLATWSRGGAVLATAPMMLDAVERPGTLRGGIAVIEQADVVRVSVAALAAQVVGDAPAAGDVLTVNDRPFVVHGQPWRDEKMGGRDWLCPVTL